MNTSEFDLADLDRRRERAYRDAPRLRQQALEVAASTLACALATALERAAGALRSLAGEPRADLAVKP
jgi:hypothetical protein